MSDRLLICIGTQKAGTTWLSDYLRGRPDVHAPLVKEVHYFDARFLPKWCAKYEEEMLADFKREVAGLTISSCGASALQQKLAAMLLRFRMINDPREYMRFMTWGRRGANLIFEATPDYAMLDRKAYSAMASMAPDVRLLFLIRNPADRFWSALRFNKTHRPDFDIDAMFHKLIDREDFRLLADYGRTIAEAKVALGPDRLHVEFFERLFTVEAIRKICEFAGLDFAAPDFAKRSNASISAAMPPDLRLKAIKSYERSYREVAELFPEQLPENWRSDLGLLPEPSRPNPLEVPRGDFLKPVPDVAGRADLPGRKIEKRF